MHRSKPAPYTPPSAFQPESPEAILAGSLALSLVREALARGARHVHLQPTADHRLEVRMRTPHGLRPGPCPFIEAKVAPLVVARLKDAAHLNVDDRRLPQEGRMTIQRVPEGPVALRVNTLPTRHGEALLIEVLESESSLTLDAVGLDPSDLARLRDVLDAPKGLVLVVGPSGSGKRTFLDACLRHVAADLGRTVYSIDDGHPTNVANVINIEVHREVEMDPDKALRLLVRNGDADVIRTPSLRYPSTAHDAVEAAASGTLVLTQLPTNDAVDGVTRLQDMSIEPYLLAAALTSVVACRALHALCPACRVPAFAPGPEALRRLVPRLFEEEILDGWEQAFTARPGGCDACQGTGHRGRVGVYEVVHRPEEIIESTFRASVRLRPALHERTRTLRESALLRAYAGLVSITEAVSATPVAPGGEPPS